MAIELPSEVAFFLNCCGVPYPDINEDDVRALSQHVRTFATSVQETHESATGAINDMGSVYSGYSYEQLLTAWATMSTTHMADLDRASRVVAQALDIAAEVITAVKAVVLTELAVLAASYATAMAAAVVTSGASAALGAAFASAARRLCSAMEQMLVGYILSELISKAIEPLEDVIGRMINGIVYNAVSNALGVPSPDSSATLPLRIEPDEVLRYAKVLDDHADDIMKHAATFADNVAVLDFTTPDRFDDGSVAVAPRVPAAIESPQSGGDLGTSPVSADQREMPRGIAQSPNVAAGAETDGPKAATTSNGWQAVREPDNAGLSAPTAPEHPVPGRGSLAGPAGGTAGTPAAAEAGQDARGAGTEQALVRHDGAQISGVAEPPRGTAEGRVQLAAGSDRPDHESTASPIASGTSASGGHGHATDDSIAPHSAQRTGPGDSSAPASPWGRAKQAPAERSAPAAPPRTARKLVARSPAARKPIGTPWSKPERTSDTPATVVASSTAGPASQRRDDKTGSEQSRDKSADRESAPAEAASDSASPPSQTRAVIIAPDLDRRH